MKTSSLNARKFTYDALEALAATRLEMTVSDFNDSGHMFSFSQNTHGKVMAETEQRAIKRNAPGIQTLLKLLNGVGFDF